MSHLPEKPSRALVQRGSDKPARRVETIYRVESEPGWNSVRQVLEMFRRNIWLIAVITAISIGISAWLVTRQVTLYSANAIIRLIDRQSGVGTGMATETPIGRVDPVLSELVVLSGRPVLGRAVDREGLRVFDAATMEPASFVDQVEITLPPDEFGRIHLEFQDDRISYGPASDRRTAAYGGQIAVEGVRFVVPSRPSASSAILYVMPREGVIDYLMGGISTVPDASTGTIQVTFTSRDSRIGPNVINAIVEEYQAVNADMERQNVRRRREFLEEQIRNTDSLLMVAQAGLSGFRSREQAYSASGRFTAEQGNLISVEIEQARLQADLRMYESALNRVLQSPAESRSVQLNALMSLPGMAGAPVVGALYTQLVGYRSELESMVTGTWGRAPTHPDVGRLNSLIASTESQLIDAAQSHVSSLRAQVASLGSLRGRAVAKMSELPRTEVEEVYLTQNLSSLQLMGNQLRDQYQAVRLEEAAESGLVEIVQPSTRSLPSASNSWIKLVLGLVLGLMVGGGVAVARELFDDSINTPEEIEQILLVPNLAVIPETTVDLEELGTNGDGPRRALEPPGYEAYRVLRTNLLFSQSDLKTLVVTSAAPGEGKTMTAVNLSVAYARQGLKVLLLECDLRRPALGRYFKNGDRGDLSDVLFEDRDWRQVVQPSGVRGLDLLLAGRALPRVAEYLAGPAIKTLLDELSKEYDIVILDTSPLLVAADATVLGAIVDGVLLVVRATHTDKKAVEQAVHQLTLVGARVVGTVLNDPEGAASRYGYNYDYSAEYKAQ